MEGFSEEQNAEIFEIASEIVIGTKKIEYLEKKLLCFDAHQRKNMIEALLNVFQKSYSLSYDSDQFNDLVDINFANTTAFSKSLKDFFSKRGPFYQNLYKNSHPIKSELRDFKWVALIPSDSKFGLTNPHPIVKCQFQTTGENFSLDFSPSAINQLVNEINSIQNSLKEMN